MAAISHERQRRLSARRVAVACLIKTESVKLDGMVNEKLPHMGHLVILKKSQIRLKRFRHAAFIELHGKFVAAHGERQRDALIAVAQSDGGNCFTLCNVDIRLDAKDGSDDGAGD